MSKPVKDMIAAEYVRRFDGIDGAVVIDIRGIDANKNNQLRLGLGQRDIRITVVRNNVARNTFRGTGLEALEPALIGPSALAFGGNSVVDVARELITWARKVQGIDFKGAVLDGEYFPGDAGVKRLSTFPTKEEAHAKVVQLVLSPGSRITGAAKGPGGRILGVVKEIQERLEKGEAIAKVG